MQRGLCLSISRKDLVEFYCRIKQSRLTLNQQAQDFSFPETVNNSLERLDRINFLSIGLQDQITHTQVGLSGRAVGINPGHENTLFTLKAVACCQLRSHIGSS